MNFASTDLYQVIETNFLGKVYRDYTTSESCKNKINCELTEKTTDQNRQEMIRQIQEEEMIK